MIQHTMIVSFTDPIPDAELDRYLADIERVMRDSGTITSYTSARHIPVAADAYAPEFTATAVVRIEVADRAALDASFAAPGVEEVIRYWQARHPYRVVWVNHEPLG